MRIVRTERAFDGQQQRTRQQRTSSGDMDDALSPPPPTLLTLPRELILAVLLECSQASTLGAVAGTCAVLCEITDALEIWQRFCDKQGLVVTGEAAATKDAVRRAHLCDHQQASSSRFDWQPGSDNQLCCTCLACGRQYEVTLTTGFVDTPAFSSKLVTQAVFRARFETPAHHQTWSAIWSRAEAAAAKQAMDASRPSSAGHAAHNGSRSTSTGSGGHGAATSWHHAVFLGQQP